MSNLPESLRKHDKGEHRVPLANVAELCYHERRRVQAGEQLPGQGPQARNLVGPRQRMLRVLGTWRSGSC